MRPAFEQFQIKYAPAYNGATKSKFSHQTRRPAETGLGKLGKNAKVCVNRKKIGKMLAFGAPTPDTMFYYVLALQKSTSWQVLACSDTYFYQPLGCSDVRFCEVVFVYYRIFSLVLLYQMTGFDRFFAASKG